MSPLTYLQIRRLTFIAQVWATLFLCWIYVGGVQKSANPELLIQNGHAGSVTVIACSPVGSLFVTGGDDYIIKLWDERSGKLQKNFVGHSGEITSLAFSRTGDLIVSGSHDGTVRLWSVRDGRQLRAFIGHRSHVLSVAFSPDSRFVASAGGSEDVSDNSIRIWETETGRLIHKLDSHTESVNSIAFSPDGEKLASGSRDGEIKIWSTKKGEIISTFENLTSSYYDRKPRRYEIKLITFSPNGRSFATLDGIVLKIRSTDDGRVLRNIKGPGDASGDLGASGATFSPDWKQVFVHTHYQSQSYLLNVDDGSLIKALDTPETPYDLSASFSNDGKRLIVARIAVPEILDAQSFKCVKCIGDATGGTHSAAFSPDGSFLAWVGNCRMNVWDLKAGQLIDIPIKEKESCVDSIVWSPDSKTLAAELEKSVIIWSVEERRIIQSFEEPNWPDDIAFSPDGRYIAWGSPSDGEPAVIKIWDRRRNQLFRKIPAKEYLLPESTEPKVIYFTIAFSHDGKRIAAGGDSQVVKVWEVETGELIHELKEHNYAITSIAFSPDGKFIAAGSTDIKLWNIESGQLINSFGKHTDLITKIEFSPDGRTIASASKDRTIKLWQIPNGELRRSFDGHASAVTSVSFSPDGRTLISSSSDTTTRLWSVNTGDWIVSFIVLGSKDWIAYTPDNYFKSSEGAEKVLMWRVEDKVYEFSKFQGEFSKPEIVVGRSRGLLTPVATTSTTTETTSVIGPAASTVAAAEDSLRERFKLMHYYALVIGNDSYQSLTNLRTPGRNAEDVAQVLGDSYGFEVKLLRNATREQILNALDSYRGNLDDNSSLLIYYAGHGTYEPDTSVTYWQPVDAKSSYSSSWISTDDVVSRIRGMKARHILVVVDSCFSGGFFDSYLSGDGMDEEPVAYLKNMMELPSRIVITSTDRDYVDDVGEEGHTVFTHRFIQGLKGFAGNIFTVKQLFNKYIEGNVINNRRVNQRPQYGPIPNSSRAGGSVNTGNFVFVRKRK